jgi:hypothetical protein
MQSCAASGLLIDTNQYPSIENPTRSISETNGSQYSISNGKEMTPNNLYTTILSHRKA